MLMETPPCTIILDREMIQLVRGDKITLKLKYISALYSMHSSNVAERRPL